MVVNAMTGIVRCLRSERRSTIMAQLSSKDENPARPSSHGQRRWLDFARRATPKHVIKTRCELDDCKAASHLNLNFVTAVWYLSRETLLLATTKFRTLMSLIRLATACVVHAQSPYRERIAHHI